MRRGIWGFCGGGGLRVLGGGCWAFFPGGFSGRGQVVEANMVDGAAYLASMPRFAMQGPMWGSSRGENLLDGGCPWYDTYETKDGEYMAVGCLEEKFYEAFVRGLGFGKDELLERMDRGNWDVLKGRFEKKFMERTRVEWEAVFDGTDACVTPVLSFGEVRERGQRMRPVVDLSVSPGLAMDERLDGGLSRDGNEYRRGQGNGVEGEGFKAQGLVPGTGGEEMLRTWLAFEKGKQYDIADDGGCELRDDDFKAKL